MFFSCSSIFDFININAVKKHLKLGAQARSKSLPLPLYGRPDGNMSTRTRLIYQHILGVPLQCIPFLKCLEINFEKICNKFFKLSITKFYFHNLIFFPAPVFLILIFFPKFSKPLHHLIFFPTALILKGRVFLFCSR